MSKNFWATLPKPFFVLAPMEDVTDVVFRHVVKEAGAPDVFFTEFTNSDSYCHPEGKDSVRGRLVFTEDEQPMVAHIWGTPAGRQGGGMSGSACQNSTVRYSS